MAGIRSYFRAHRWQRRLLTAALALLLGALAAVLAGGYVLDTLLLCDLDSPRPSVRAKAIGRAVARASDRPATLRRLNEALDDASDRQFVAIVSALRWLGELNSPDRDPLHIDRLHALELESNPSPETRAIFLAETFLTGRDNPHVRRALAAAVADPNAVVRRRAGILAARLGDDGALASLLADDDPRVVTATVLDIGLAGRYAFADRLAEMLDVPAPDERAAAAAVALAALDPNAAAPAVAAALAAAEADGNDTARDRLLHVLGGIDAAPARGAVRDALERAEPFPPAAALLAAARLRLGPAAKPVRKVLGAAAVADPRLTVPQVHAAVAAAASLDLPVAAELDAICRTLWTHRYTHRLMLAAAARELGRQTAQQLAAEGDRADPARFVRTLRLAAVADYPDPEAAPPATASATAPATAPAVPMIRTPLPSAAAATALWLLRTPAGDEFIRVPAGEDFTLAGDYIAWHLPAGDGRRALELGYELLPAPGAPPAERVYDDDARSTGALLLAMAARTGSERAAAARRIRSRLIGDDLGGEDSFFVRGAYHCGLGILGDANSLDRVGGLLETGQFSQRRAITALTVAGRLDGLDWLLWNPQVDGDDMLLLLVDELLCEVLAACLPELPRVRPAATAELQRWQLAILRRAYAIRRGRLRPRRPCPSD